MGQARGGGGLEAASRLEATAPMAPGTSPPG